MAEQWFYEKEGHQYGPLSPQQMRSLGQSGKLAPDDLVWREGMQTKIPAGKYKGLLPGQSVPQSELSNASTETEVVIDAAAADHMRAGRSQRSGRLSGGAIFNLGLESQSFVYKNWIAVVFLTIVFVLACAGAAAMIITLPLVPVFMMGYVANLTHIRQGQAIQWEEFILFLRRGWPSLFNVFELGAVFILITAVVILFLYLCGIFSSLVSILAQTLSVEIGIIVSVLVILPVSLMGIALSLGVSTAYWAIVYAAKEDGSISGASDEVSIFLRLQSGLQAIGSNKAAVIRAGACIALIALAYGLVFLLFWFVVGLITREMGYRNSGLILRQLLFLFGAAFSFLLGSTGLASIFVYHAVDAERIVERFRREQT
jgi:hypothetical protein